MQSEQATVCLLLSGAGGGTRWQVAAQPSERMSSRDWLHTVAALHSGLLSNTRSVQKDYSLNQSLLRDSDGQIEGPEREKVNGNRSVDKVSSKSATVPSLSPFNRLVDLQQEQQQQWNWHLTLSLFCATVEPTCSVWIITGCNSDWLLHKSCHETSLWKPYHGMWSSLNPAWPWHCRCTFSSICNLLVRTSSAKQAVG